MIVSQSGGVFLFVPLALLKRPDGTHVRFFSSSEGIVSYLKAHPGQDYVLEPTGNPLTYLESGPGDYGPQYGDVFIGQVRFDQAANQVVCG